MRTYVISDYGASLGESKLKFHQPLGLPRHGYAMTCVNVVIFRENGKLKSQQEVSKTQFVYCTHAKVGLLVFGHSTKSLQNSKLIIRGSCC